MHMSVQNMQIWWSRPEGACCIMDGCLRAIGMATIMVGWFLPGQGVRNWLHKKLSYSTPSCVLVFCVGMKWPGYVSVMKLFTTKVVLARSEEVRGFFVFEK